MEQVVLKESALDKFLASKITSSVSLILLVVGVIYWVINPQIANDKAVSLLSERVSAQRTTIDELTKTQQNDLHTIEGEIKDLRDAINNLAKEQAAMNALVKQHMGIK